MAKIFVAAAAFPLPFVLKKYFWLSPSLAGTWIWTCREYLKVTIFGIYCLYAAIGENKNHRVWTNGSVNFSII